MTRLPCRSVTVACNTTKGTSTEIRKELGSGACPAGGSLVSGVGHHDHKEKGHEPDRPRHEALPRLRQPRPHSSSPSYFVTGRRAKLPRRHNLRKLRQKTGAACGGLVRYRTRFCTILTPRAPPKASSPNSAISGSALEVAGSTSADGVDAVSAVSSTAGGGVTTAASFHRFSGRFNRHDGHGFKLRDQGGGDRFVALPLESPLS